MKIFKKLFGREYGTGLRKDPRTQKEKEKDYLSLEVLSYIPPKWQEKKPENWRKFPIFNQAQSGSCFPSETLVLTEDFSYKPIGEIKKGEYVFTHKGRKRKVIETFKRKWQGTMKSFVIWGDYREITATQEHPILGIKRPDKNRFKYIGNSKNKWIKNEEFIRSEPLDFYSLKELSKGDWVAIPFNNIIKDKTIYSFEKDPDFLWLLGLYLAEGSSDKYKVCFSLHRKEFDWYERIKSIMAKYGTNTTYSFKEDTGFTIRISGKKWVNIFQELGDKLCENKKINKRLMFLEPHLQMKIVEGFTDGDGYRNRGRKQCNTLVSTSETLLIQIRTILLRNKIYSSLQKRKERDDRKPVWVLEHYKQSQCGFIKDNYYFAQIKETKTTPAFTGGYVYNLEVEEDNSYIVNGIAVHNCVGQTYAKLLGVENVLEEGKWVHFSARDIYSQRSIKPAFGMHSQEAAEICYKKGATIEQLMPSQNLPEVEMNKEHDRKEIDRQVALVGKAGGYLSLPFDFDKLASVMEQTKKAIAIACWFNSGDWSSAEVTTRANGTSGHLVALVDYCLWKGKKALVFDNSWDYRWGHNGQGIIVDGNHQGVRDYCVYLQDLHNNWRDTEVEIPKPKYTFNNNLQFGQRNNDVIALQDALKYFECFPVETQSTGYYSVITAKSVLKWQLQYKVDSEEELIKLEGKHFGPKSRKAMNDLLS